MTACEQENGVDEPPETKIQWAQVQETAGTQLRSALLVKTSMLQPPPPGNATIDNLPLPTHSHQYPPNRVILGPAAAASGIPISRHSSPATFSPVQMPAELESVYC